VYSNFYIAVPYGNFAEKLFRQKEGANLFKLPTVWKNIRTLSNTKEISEPLLS
jgi:hypothetical protein